jgi:hypothetical protein
MIQWSSNLAAWNDLKTFVNPVASTNFWCITPLSDTSAPAASGRFYRLLAQ